MNLFPQKLHGVVTVCPPLVCFITLCYEYLVLAEHFTRLVQHIWNIPGNDDAEFVFHCPWNQDFFQPLRLKFYHRDRGVFSYGKIPREELFPAENLLNDAQYVDNGKLTEAGLGKLKALMPHVDFTEFEKDPDLNKMPDLFRVDSIVNYIDNKVNAA